MDAHGLELEKFFVNQLCTEAKRTVHTKSSMYQSREVQVSEQTLLSHRPAPAAQRKESCAAEQSQEALIPPQPAAPLHVTAGEHL